MALSIRRAAAFSSGYPSYSELISIMKIPLTPAELAFMLDDPELIIFAVGPDNKRYCVQRKVVQSATRVFDVAPPWLIKIDAYIRILSSEKTEVFDEFVAWLYSRNLPLTRFDQSIDLDKLIRVYIFALMWHVRDLKNSTMKALMDAYYADFDLLIDAIDKVFEAENDQYRRRMTPLLDAISEPQLSLNDFTIDGLLNAYTLSIKWRCNRLKNKIMGVLQDTLLAESQMLTLDQVVKVFNDVQSSADERIRRFCVALYHHQRFDPECMLPMDLAVNYYTDADNFIVDYMEFEQEVMFCRISCSYEVGDDPRDRKRGSFPQCYFHVHGENEECHIPSDQRVVLAE